jgi:hypothetical protein
MACPEIVGVSRADEIDHRGAETISEIAVAPFKNRGVLALAIRLDLLPVTVEHGFARQARPCLAVADQYRAIRDAKSAGQFDRSETSQGIFVYRLKGNEP